MTEGSAAAGGGADGGGRRRVLVTWLRARQKPASSSGEKNHSPCTAPVCERRRAARATVLPGEHEKVVLELEAVDGGERLDKVLRLLAVQDDKGVRGGRAAGERARTRTRTHLS